MQQLKDVQSVIEEDKTVFGITYVIVLKTT